MMDSTSAICEGRLGKCRCVCIIGQTIFEQLPRNKEIYHKLFAYSYVFHFAFSKPLDCLYQNEVKGKNCETILTTFLSDTLAQFFKLVRRFNETIS